MRLIDARRIVLERATVDDVLACERCGRTITGDYSIHHRRPRGSGGSKDPATNSPANLLLLGGSGTTGCHGLTERYRSSALHFGWLVHQGHNPADVPVMYRNRRALLGDDGSVTYLPVMGGEAA